MVERSNTKPWWESNLEWTISASLQEKLEAGQRFIRGLPGAINAHHLEQPSHVDDIEPDPVEKIAKAQPARRMPRILPPPPKPACLERRELTTKVSPARAVNMPTQFPLADLHETQEEPEKKKEDEEKAPTKDLTLEQLLDPDFCGYTS